MHHLKPAKAGTQDRPPLALKTKGINDMKQPDDGPEPRPFDLDLNRLDEEWVRQPRRYFVEAVKLADARRDLEMAKAAADVTAAEIDQDVRASPATFGLEKITEPAVERTVSLQKRMIEAKHRIISARHFVYVQQAMVDALDQKKHALQDAVKLQLANYFSAPRVDGDDGRRMGEAKADAAFGAKKKKAML